VWAASASLARLPEGYIELGFFTAANNWRTAMAFLPSMLSSAAIPIFASLIVQRDGRRDRGLESYHLANSSLTWLLAGSIVVLSPWIMRAYGPAYADRWQVLVVLTLGAAIGMQGNTMGTVIQARGLMWTGLTINLVWAAVLLAVAFAARGYGALGLGIAYPAAYLAIMPPTALLLAWLGLISPAIARRALSAGAALALLLPAALAIHAARLGPASSSALLAALVAGAYAASENAAARRLLARAYGLLPARDRRPALERAS
jgi:O-antigen/teichoic acid export membrane protein